ncbi:hypothetical protein HLV39_05355 [Marinobacter adhaerens]|uniref:Uncharacterized protein n=1 Tax=Marinobacter adhaerens TaxID=1033846 RepID=A0A851HY80_9GAMM|nr:hypothetical protein [Marinobacter adhaerens]NWN90918.1 hypothetical protein [Marinobacter adhaerens]
MVSIDYAVDAQGQIQYTPSGFEKFRVVFSEHGIDINRINSLNEHREALYFYLDETLFEPNGNDLSAEDRSILISIMSNPDNDEVEAIMRDHEADLRRSEFRLIICDEGESCE